MGRRAGGVDGQISLGEGSSCSPKRRTFHARITASRSALIPTSGTRSRRTSSTSSLSTTESFKLFFLVEFKRAVVGRAVRGGNG